MSEPWDHPPERSAAEIDAAFASIVSGLAGHLRWDGAADPQHPAGTGPGPADGDVTGQDSTHESATDDERERRRARRRAERAGEVAEFAAASADAEAELQADDAHFVPPEPPPVPRPGRRTVAALLCMAVGVLLLLRPNLVQVGSDVALVLAMTALVGGFGILVYGLRPRAADPDDAGGWDDGARL